MVSEPFLSLPSVMENVQKRFLQHVPFLVSCCILFYSPEISVLGLLTSCTLTFFWKTWSFFEESSKANNDDSKFLGSFENPCSLVLTSPHQLKNFILFNFQIQKLNSLEPDGKCPLLFFNRCHMPNFLYTILII